MRLTACFGMQLHVIGPTGFPWDARRIRRSAMDYIDHAKLAHHASWAHFCKEAGTKRKILLTTRADHLYTEFTYRPDDIILVGRESAGVPNDVHEAADERLLIPMVPACRSLNVITSAAMVIGEALRQTKGFPA